MKEVAIFGSTGSVGRNAVELMCANPGLFRVKALVAKDNAKLIIEQAKLLRPDFVVIENNQHFELISQELKDLKNCTILSGFDAILDVSKIKCDLVISAIVGVAGMMPTMNAINAGSNIALANKESIVCAGELMTKAAKKSGSKIIPIDSEHNAIFQVLEDRNIEKVEDIVLTASGGPFFHSSKPFDQITVEEALNHPKWKMGPKISIDCATMMNKGLEMIEAFYLFPLNSNQIKIIVHPQSIIHGIVNYKDGSSLAMMSVPDMKIPIAHALQYPNRIKIDHERLDLVKLGKMEFFELDEAKFSAIALCRQALKVGGNALANLNAANEIAVEKFLSKQIRFDQIVEINKVVLDQIQHTKIDSLSHVLECDKQARRVALEVVSRL